MAPRCRRCHRVLTNSDNIKHGYGPVCYFKTFGFHPKKSSLKIQKYRGYITKCEIPPLFQFQEEADETGTITVINLSTLTDKAALAVVADYYSNKNDVELQNFLKTVKVRIFKKGHKFTVLNNEESKR